MYILVIYYSKKFYFVMINKYLREKFGVFAKVWLILAGKLSVNPNMVDFGIDKERLEKIIKEDAEKAIRGLLKTLDKTCIAVTPLQINQRDFRDILDPVKSDSVKDVKEVTYNSGAGSFRVSEYQPEGTSRSIDVRCRINIGFVDECGIDFYWIEKGKFKLKDKEYKLIIYRPQDSGKKLSIENIPLEEVPELSFSLFYKPAQLVRLEEPDNLPEVEVA